MRIQDSKPGRRDGGYARMFNDPDIGALMSRIHATSIRAGTELEHIIQREAQANGTAIHNLDTFLSNGMDGVFIASKKVIKKSLTIQFSGAEPDYLVFERKGTLRKCIVLALKDGDQFDTKKSRGEVQTLSRFALTVGSALPYATEIRICSFNQSSKQAIVTGFKGAIDESLVWTGREFCELLGFDYDSLVEERKKDAEVNRQFLADQILRIEALRKIMEEKLQAPT